MIIRSEKKKDYKEIKNVVKVAFDRTELSDGDEHNLVDRLRKSGAYIPELSLVALENEKILGHIMFTKIQIGEETGLALAPLSVLPEYEKKGIGKALIKKGHEIAKEMGYSIIIVLGHSGYYTKFGYEKASDYKIYPPFKVPDEAFMVHFLKEYISKNKCIVEYASEFFQE